MNQNTSGENLARPDAAGTAGLVTVDDAIVERATQRALARRQAVYADEVRRLLDAGLEVMRQCGTAKSPPVSDIVAAARLSRDAFYRHFASKEDLVAAIVEAGAQRLRGYLRHQMGKEDDPAGTALEEPARSIAVAMLSGGDRSTSAAETIYEIRSKATETKSLVNLSKV